MSVWPTIARFISEHGAAALVTLAESRGSSPRETGARMVVRPDGGFTGTIGGGALEWMALAEAQALLSRPDERAMRRLDKALGPDLGQCCGGRVKITIEKFDSGDREAVNSLAEAERNGPFATVGAIDDGRLQRRLVASGEVPQAASGAYSRQRDGTIVERFGSAMTPLYLFGAGHVGRALALALAPLPFAVTWVDPRPNAMPERVLGNVTCVVDREPAQVLERAPGGAFIAVMTHSHALDLDLVAAALKAGRFPYVGLIGSATKRARFVSTLRKLGLREGEIDRLVCPIGITEIRDKAPAAIAASVAAQLLIVRDRLASRQAEPETTASAGVRHG
jgi:xanthine dehydrogenase accessory factor